MTKAQAKLPYDLPRMFRLIRESIRPYARAMLFELADDGFQTPFEILAACVLSIRTLDEVSLVAAHALFKRARDPQSLLKIPEDELARLISPCSFSRQKAASLRAISKILIDEHQGKAPCDFEGLTSLPGIGPKCAGLILGIACHEPRIAVDIHVHRITNRWGYVHAPTPEKTRALLAEKLPRRHWVEINELLVPFGKHICRGSKPLCPVCPVLKYCRQVGVHSVAVIPKKKPADSPPIHT